MIPQDELLSRMGSRWNPLDYSDFELHRRQDMILKKSKAGLGEFPPARRFLAMPNHDIEATWRYHEATEHSPQSVRTSGHYLDWTTYPLPFKVYPDLDPIPMPRDWRA